jgi:hypothetical protein
MLLRRDPRLEQDFCLLNWTSAGIGRVSEFLDQAQNHENMDKSKRVRDYGRMTCSLYSPCTEVGQCKTNHYLMLMPGYIQNICWDETLQLF